MKQLNPITLNIKTIIQTLCFLCIILSYTIQIGRCQSIEDHKPTGLRPPTPAEALWIEKNAIKTKEVKLNRIGLQRINLYRKHIGLALLADTNVVSFGNEVIADDDVAKLTNNLSLRNIESPSTIIPGFIDNSTLPCFPPIRSQLNQNSCAAFSTTYYTMTHMTGLVRGWDTSGDFDNTNKFSPKWTYNLLNDGDDGGISLETVYPLLLKNGASKWSDFPYEGEPFGINPENSRELCLNPSIWRDAINYRMSACGYIDNIATNEGLLNLKLLLIDGYVLNFCTYFSWTYIQIKDDPQCEEDNQYIGKDVCSIVTSTDSPHAMTIVGYNDSIWVDVDDDNVIDAGEKGALRIANSHGTGSGDNGFYWLSYAAIQSNYHNYPHYWYNAMWDSRAYWMTARKEYTPKLLAKVTLNGNDRQNMHVILGTSPNTETQPEMEWESEALHRKGGHYAFDGTTAACDGTFIFDFTDLMSFPTPVTKRWWASALDYAPGSPTVMKYFALLDGYTGNLITDETFYASADGSLISPDRINASLDLYFAPRPDAMISIDESMQSYVGDNIYNITSEQTSTQQTATESTYYTVKAQNDGSISDQLVITGQAGTGDLIVTYYTDAGKDITDIVTSTGYKQWVSLGNSIDCVVAVKHLSSIPIGTTQEVDITVTSTNDSTKTDTVRAVTTKTAPLSAVYLSTTPISPTQLGTPITLTATPTGGARVEYKFRAGWQQYGTWYWTDIQDYSRDNTCIWLPAEIRKYTIVVMAREVGSTSEYGVYSSMYYYTIVSGVSLATNLLSPQATGTCITLTATPSPADITGNIEYLFKAGFQSNGVWTWTTLQDYSETRSCTWQPMQAQQYTIVVYARTKGRTVAYDAYDSEWFSIQ